MPICAEKICDLCTSLKLVAPPLDPSLLRCQCQTRPPAGAAAPGSWRYISVVIGKDMQQSHIRIKLTCLLDMVGWVVVSPKSLLVIVSVVLYINEPYAVAISRWTSSSFEWSRYRWFVIIESVLCCDFAVVLVGSEVSYVELYDGPDGKSIGSGYILLLLLTDIAQK